MKASEKIRNLLIFGSMFMLLGQACKKDSAVPDSPSGSSPCKVISGGLVVYQDTIYSTREWDSKGRVMRIVYHYPDNEIIVFSFSYQGDKISQVIYNVDTATFFYNNEGLLSTKKSKDARTDEYFYDLNKQIVKTRVWFVINSINTLADSTMYFWSGGNILSSIKHYTPTFTSWVTLSQTYTYDTKVNYLKENGMPESDFKSWSKNNLLTSVVEGYPELNFTYEYPEYNSYGLPTKIRWSHNQINYTELVNYECK